MEEQDEIAPWRGLHADRSPDPERGEIGEWKDIEAYWDDPDYMGELSDYYKTHFRFSDREIGKARNTARRGFFEEEYGLNVDRILVEDIRAFVEQYFDFDPSQYEFYWYRDAGKISLCVSEPFSLGDEFIEAFLVMLKMQFSDNIAGGEYTIWDLGVKVYHRKWGD